ncbi:MAG TPA: hypothetical protein VM818_13060 [Vicinamibacterales bacterium]|jgi:hypothetical protein|nr:hypothetical protein [Vicinamibacterales bacterium]
MVRVPLLLALTLSAVTVHAQQRSEPRSFRGGPDRPETVAALVARTGTITIAGRFF